MENVKLFVILVVAVVTGVVVGVSGLRLLPCPGSDATIIPQSCHCCIPQSCQRGEEVPEEVSVSRYNEMAQILNKHPNLTPLGRQLMADGVITTEEYEVFMRTVGAADGT